MPYIYIIFPFAVWVISQTIKFLLRLDRKEVPLELKGFWWTYVWASGPPSTHTAIITSCLCLVWHTFGLSPVFTFSLAVTMLWLFDIANERKRQTVLNAYFARESSENLKKIASDGRMLDLSGHTLPDIICGAALGVALAAGAIYMFAL
jgi:acid phosphatase family membrane protein YuiD